jgi:hypothetical protein
MNIVFAQFATCTKVASTTTLSIFVRKSVFLQNERARENHRAATALPAAS